jgi:hypothetical protein
MEGQGERMYSSYSFTISALDGVSGQRHAPAALYSRGKDPSTHWTGGLALIKVINGTDASINRASNFIPIFKQQYRLPCSSLIRPTPNLNNV